MYKAMTLALSLSCVLLPAGALADTNLGSEAEALAWAEAVPDLAEELASSLSDEQRADIALLLSLGEAPSEEALGQILNEDQLAKLDAILIPPKPGSSFASQGACLAATASAWFVFC